MGLMKTLSLSSKELKDILDRLKALESGETFATKEMFESLNQTVTTINTDVTNIKNGDNIENIMLSNYPVGSIYFSIDSVNPSTKFGGTWVAWGAGRVPVGVSADDSNFNSVEKTGGESRHTLTTAELPSSLEAMAPMAYGMVNNGSGNAVKVWEAGNVSAKITLDLVGLNAGHNNLQPYITCYMWKRTA